MAATKLNFVNLYCPVAGDTPKLMLSTPSGTIREVELTDKQLAQLLKNAANIAAHKLNKGGPE